MTLGLLVVLSITLVWNRATRTEAASTYSPSEQILFDEINAQRSQLGLNELKWNQALYRAAHTRADDMFHRQYFNHIAPDGSTPWTVIERDGYSYNKAGENLAIDFHAPSDAIPAWLASPSHRANIASSAYEDSAIAIVAGSMNGQTTLLIVQLFGTAESL